MPPNLSNTLNQTPRQTAPTLTLGQDEALRDNLKILQRQSKIKIPGISVPAIIDLPELAAPPGGVGNASAANAAATGPRGDQPYIPIPPTSKIGEAVVRAALQMRGIPYSWGGGTDKGPSLGIAQGANTVGFDCSSLVKYAFAQYGVTIPRVTYDQFRAGTPVPADKMMPGDLVFFNPGVRGPDHMGIFIGNGKFLQAPQTGDVVKISDLSSRSDLVGVRRFG